MKPKNPAGFRIGIVNPLTLVGNEIKTILRDRSFPFSKLTLPASVVLKIYLVIAGVA